jgi:hypothetical protein
MSINLRRDKESDVHLVYVGSFAETMFYCDEKDYKRSKKIIDKINLIWDYHDYDEKVN